MFFYHKISWKKIEENKRIIVRENSQSFAILYLYLIAFVNSVDPFKKEESIELLFERKAQYNSCCCKKNYNAMVSRQM